MFFAGNPEDIATMYWERCATLTGPPLPAAPADELSLEELKFALVWARTAYNTALTEGAPDSVLDVLIERHDALFEALAAVDDRFRDRVLGKIPGKIIWLGGYSEENIAKYKALASAN